MQQDAATIEDAEVTASAAAEAESASPGAAVAGVADLAEGVAPTAEGAEGAAATAAADDGAEGEVIVTIGDDPAANEEEEAKHAPAWVKDLRKANREKDRRIRELEAKVAASTPAQRAIEVGPKPTLASCEYDEEKLEQELDAWHARKRQADDEQRAKDEAERKSKDAWAAKLSAYTAQKAALRVPDFEDAEEAVLGKLSVVQQGIIVQGAKNSALLVCALGKNPKKLAEIAAITDPVQFAVAIGELGAQVKTQQRKPATSPEKSAPRSSMSGASAVDNELARLQEQATKTGDRTPVVRYLQGKKLQAA